MNCMSLEHDGEPGSQSAAERLSELTGKPVEEFEYHGDIPELDELERERVEEELPPFSAYVVPRFELIQ